MGQTRASISKVVMDYLRWQHASPKILLAEIYPLFERIYPSKDTFRRLLHRALGRLEKNGRIVKHPLRPYYCAKGSHDLDLLLRQGWFHQIGEPMEIHRFTKRFETEKVTFAENYMKKK